MVYLLLYHAGGWTGICSFLLFTVISKKMGITWFVIIIFHTWKEPFVCTLTSDMLNPMCMLGNCSSSHFLHYSFFHLGLKPWSNVMEILEEKDGVDTELLVYAMTLLNKVCLPFGYACLCVQYILLHGCWQKQLIISLEQPARMSIAFPWDSAHQLKWPSETILWGVSLWLPF